MNMLALDALDVLHYLGPRLVLQALPPDLPSALLTLLGQVLQPLRNPLRLRTAAAGLSACPSLCL